VKVSPDKWSRLAREASFNASRFADLLEISLRTLERIAQKEFGKTPKAWLREQRLVGAAEVIRTSNSVRMAAQQFGYRHACNFSRDFKAVNGTLPRELLPRKPKRPKHVKRPHRYIYRRSPPGKAYRVYIDRSGRSFSQDFTDRTHGGRAEAFKAAREYRDKLLKQLKRVKNARLP
jgi:AraC-like DNA-binding protein